MALSFTHLCYSHTTMDHEVACVDISPLGGHEKAELCAIGLWTDISVQLLTVPGLEKAFTQPLGGGMYLHMY